MRIPGIVIGLLLASVAYAQEIDESRMERDLKVAEDIIGSLMSQSEVGKVWRNTQVNGNYIQDYGVIFHIPTGTFSWPLGIKLWDGDGGLVMGNKIRISDDEETVLGFIDDYEDYQANKDDYLEEMIFTFLADYADLIGQLNPRDRIMIKSVQRLNNVFVLGSVGKFKFNYKDGDDFEVEGEVDRSDGAEDYIISAEVLKSDLTAYRNEDLSREDLLDRIMIEKQNVYNEKEPELELLSSIFHRLYKSDLSETYFATSPPSYNRIANFGVIYDWKVYASNIDDGKHNMPTIDSYGLSVEERNTEVEQLYPVFVQQFKQQIIEYGRTLKGLDKDEILMFKIRLTECKGCAIPATITASVKRSVLNDFERQKISLTDAVKQVTVTEKKAD